MRTLAAVLAAALSVIPAVAFGQIARPPGGGGGNPLTVEESDSNPAVANVVTLQVDQLDGLTISDQGGNVALIGIGTLPDSVVSDTLTIGASSTIAVGALPATVVLSDAASTTLTGDLVIQGELTIPCNVATEVCTNTADNETVDPVEPGANEVEWGWVNGLLKFFPNGGELKTVATVDQVGTPFDLCRDGTVKGGGYDSTTNRYDWTNCYYPWTTEAGGGSGAYGTATNPGSVNSSYEPTCTGPYEPDEACAEAGERPIINASANIALAIDHTKDGGDVYCPIPEGRSSGLYVLSGCGEQSDGTDNNCPVYRAPYDTFEGGRQVQLVRGITLHLEGSDPDGIRRVIDGSGRPRRTGVYLLGDSGHSPGGFDPGAGSSGAGTNRRIVFIGLDGGNVRCNGTTEGTCTSPSTDVKGIPVNRTGSASGFAVLEDPDHSDVSWCIDNTTTGSLGVCNGDRRYSCSSDSDCTAVNGAWACLGGADLLEAEIEGTDPLVPSARDRVTWGWRGEQKDALDTTGTANLSGLVAFEAVTATTCGASNEGLLATIFSEDNQAAVDFHRAEIQFVYPVPTDAVMTGGGIEGGTWAPANSFAYKWNAAEMPTCDASHDGLVVSIVDDDGSCSATAGVLDGGSTTESECWCDFSGAGDWAAPACGTLPPTGQGDLRGCSDSSALAFGDSTMGVVEDLHVTGWDKLDTTPVIDITGMSATGKNLLRNVLFDWNKGRLTDIGAQFDCQGCVFADNDASGSTLLSVGFAAEQEWTDTRLERNAAAALFSLGEGAIVNILNTTLIANSVDDHFRLSDEANGVRICGVRGYSGNGHLLTVRSTIVPAVIGRVELCDVNMHLGATRLRASIGTGDQYSVISFSDQNNNGDGATWLGPFLIHDVHIETEVDNAILVHFDGTAAGEGTSTIDEMRSRVSILNSSISNVLYGGNAEIAWILDDNATPAERDITDGSDIWLSTNLPRMKGNFVNGVPVPDYDYGQMAAADAGDCTAAPSANGEVGPGTVAAIFNDTSANACDDSSPADGVLDGGGTAKSVCFCGVSGWASL